MLFVAYFLLILPLICAKPVLLDNLDYYEVAHASEIGGGFVRRKLLARTGEFQPYRMKFQLSAVHEQDEMEFELYRDDALFGPSYHHVRETYRDGELIHQQYQPFDKSIDNCFYQGEIASHDEPTATKVLMNTCKGGYTGYVRDADGAVLMVEPAHLHMDSETLSGHVQALQAAGHDADDTTAHIVFKLSDYQHPGGSCGVSAQDQEDATAHFHDLGNLLQNMEGSSSHAGHDHAHEKRFDKQIAATQRVEFLAVNDFRRYEQVGTFVEFETAEIVQYMNMFYNQSALVPPVSAVLIGQVTFDAQDPWSGDLLMTECSLLPDVCDAQGVCKPVCDPEKEEIPVSGLLNEFHDWRGVQGRVVENDNAHLFSGYNFQSEVVGFAGVLTMCALSSSGGIDQTLNHLNIFSGSIVSHEMGHNFGFLHDGSLDALEQPINTCPTSGYIMNSVISNQNDPPSDFSPCSHQYYLRSWLDTDRTCLDDEPASAWGNPICGNGFIEANDTIVEQCDCGSKTDCSRTNTSLDICCNPADCQLQKWAQCPLTDPCCDNCVVAAEGKVCRAAANDCDLPEKCDGISSLCPPDEVKGTGNVCFDEAFNVEGLCHFGECMTYEHECDVATKGLERDDGPPFQPCRKIELYSKTPCRNLYCQGESNDAVCFGFETAPSEGTPCPGEYGVCSSTGQCVSPSSLNKNYYWVPEAYPPCYDCDDTQVRVVGCKVQEVHGFLISVLDEQCSPDNRPTTQQYCLNPDMNCVHSVHDNELDVFARQVSIDYGALGMSKDLQSRIPRACGPDTIDITSEDKEKMNTYSSCTYLLMMPGFIFAGLSFGFVGSYFFCFDNYWRNICNVDRPKGYTSTQRWAPFGGYILLGSVVLLFSSIGAFYNGEVRRSITDEVVGLNVKLLEFVENALNKAIVLQGPLVYMASEDNLRNLDTTIQLLSFVQEPSQTGTKPIVKSIKKFGDRVTNYTVYVPGLGDAFYTSPDVSYECAFCKNLDKIVRPMANEIGNYTAPYYVDMYESSSQSLFSLVGLQSQLSGGGELISVLNSTKDLEEFFAKTYSKTSKFLVEIEALDKIRHPLTLSLFMTPFFSFIVAIFAKLMTKGDLFRWNMYGLMGVLVISWVFFGLHLPLGLLFYDTCLFMDSVEVDISALGLAPLEGSFVHACLNSGNLVEAMNLTDELDYETQVQFPAPPNMTILFKWELLDELQHNISMLTVNGTLNWQEDIDEVYIRNQLFALNTNVAPYQLTPMTWTEENVSLVDPLIAPDDGAREAIRRAKWNTLSRMKARAAVYSFLDEMNQNISQIMMEKELTYEATVQIINALDSARINSEDIIAAGGALVENANCDLGEFYSIFKASLCDTLSVAIAFLVLSLLVLGVFLYPMTIFSYQAAEREEKYEGWEKDEDDYVDDGFDNDHDRLVAEIKKSMEPHGGYHHGRGGTRGKRGHRQTPGWARKSEMSLSEGSISISSGSSRDSRGSFSDSRRRDKGRGSRKTLAKKKQSVKKGSRKTMKKLDDFADLSDSPPPQPRKTLKARKTLSTKNSSKKSIKPKKTDFSDDSSSGSGSDSLSDDKSKRQSKAQAAKGKSVMMKRQTSVSQADSKAAARAKQIAAIMEKRKTLAAAKAVMLKRKTLAMKASSQKSVSVPTIKKKSSESESDSGDLSSVAARDDGKMLKSLERLEPMSAKRASLIAPLPGKKASVAIAKQGKKSMMPKQSTVMIHEESEHSSSGSDSPPPKAKAAPPAKQGGGRKRRVLSSSGSDSESSSGSSSF